MSTIQEQFAVNLREQRKRKCMSQEDLAFRAGLHRTQISLLEQGQRVPRFETLIKLAGALRVTLNDLAEGIVWEPILSITGGLVVVTSEGDDEG